MYRRGLDGAGRAPLIRQLRANAGTVRGLAWRFARLTGPKCGVRGADALQAGATLGGAADGCAGSVLVIARAALAIAGRAFIVDAADEGVAAVAVFFAVSALAIAGRALVSGPAHFRAALAVVLAVDVECLAAPALFAAAADHWFAAVAVFVALVARLAIAVSSLDLALLFLGLSSDCREQMDWAQFLMLKR